MFASLSLLWLGLDLYSAKVSVLDERFDESVTRKGARNPQLVTAFEENSFQLFMRKYPRVVRQSSTEQLDSDVHPRCFRFLEGHESLLRLGIYTQPEQ